MKTSSAGSHFIISVGWVICLAFVCLSFRGASAARLGDSIPVTTTIQAAIDAAQDGDTISIPAGLYTESLVVDKSLTLAVLPGVGGNWATIWPNGNSRIITVQPGHNLTLIDLVLSGGYPDGPGTNEGGAVFIEDGNLTIDHCYIYSNDGNYGGAVRQKGAGQVMVQNGSKIYNNTAGVDGGGIYADGNLSLTDSDLEYNQAGRHGGGVSVMGQNFTALRGKFLGNTANENGGGANVNKNASVDQVEFTNNLAGTNGGGLFQWDGNHGLSVVIQNSIFDGNQSGLTGGAVSIYNGAATTIDVSQFLNNTVDTQSTTDPLGGAVYFSDSSWGHDITIDRSTFSANSIDCTNCYWPSGGGVYTATFAAGTLHLDDSLLIDNEGWLGGGVYANSAVIDRVTFQRNTGGSGGGAYLTGPSQILKSAFLQNSVVNNGGGLAVTINAPSLTMEDTKLIGNTGGVNCGGAIQADAESITMKNVVVADTQVVSGGAIVFENVQATISLYHVTVNDTHLQGGARTGTIGIHIKRALNTNIFNSMITSHGTGVKIDPGSAVNLYNTLWYNNAPHIDGAAGWYADYSPIFSDPAYALDRYHLTVASGAINQGADRMTYHDIDGDARDSLPDIGADEFRVHLFLPQVVR